MGYDCGLFVGGKERPARSGAVISVRSPATGEVIGNAAEAGEDDVAQAVAAAAAAAGAWAASSRSQRADCLYRLAALIAEHAGELAAIETSETGRPISVTKDADLRSAAETVTYCAGMPARTEGARSRCPASS